ncbi:MAG: TonB C-terminal domain-containing protein [Opitutales bacterium]|nr:TonB C-terminal domain-containing protein [Opitutales bacterium]
MLTAFALHALVIVVAVVFAVLDRLRTEEPVHVFELVSLSEEPPSPDPAPSPPAPASEPDPEPLTVEELEELREIPPLPESPPPPAPEPQPTPAPEPPRQVRFEDWARDRNLPDRVQRVEPQRRAAAPQPRIETNIRERLREVSDLRVEDFRAASSREQSEMEAYLNTIRARLRAAFEPVGVDHVARVRFEVGADGRIGRVDIVERSGNPVFDESVRRTFQSIGRFPPPPSGRAHSWTTTFRSTD